VRTTASGQSSTTMGVNTTASGGSSTAMGDGAMGSFASTNGHRGSFVYGDASTVGTAIPVVVQSDNSFAVRAQRVWFGKTGDQVATPFRYIETSTGGYLSDGGAWTNSSDRDKKENFRDEHGETVLAKIAELSIQGWNYKAEDPSVRHLGPTAQDFHAAFGLGDSDKHIATVDIDGVNLLAVQALEKRTTDLRVEVAALREENAELLRRLVELEAILR
ncbi:MAG: tail fiber domain-containing protein, partial [Gemmatimonadetes bacterium]|nr:tail fiber domain-containing protein [Gemmatimonadota bacterium]